MDDDTQFLKSHGVYQQDDRDLRKTGKKYIFMVRCRIPGGVLTPAQYLACDDLASRYANNTLRVTSRQGFQFHGVVKGGLRALVKEINDALLGTLAACGDNNRNVMAPPTPPMNKLGEQVQEHARQVAAAVLPRTRAYHSIWIEGVPLDLEDPANKDFVDPLYGKTYLPRKFKIAFAIPPLNDIDIFTNCCGFIAIGDGSGKLFGYNLTAGGGMGRSHGNVATFPRLADVIGFLPPEKVVDVAKAVVTIHRDFGDRSDRKHARLKYVLEDRGAQWFREELERRVGFRLARTDAVQVREARRRVRLEPAGRWAAVPWPVRRDGPHQGPGRLADEDGACARLWRSISRKSISRPANNVILANLDAAQRDEITRLFAEHGVQTERERQGSILRRASMACVSLPTCGLGLAESERYLPDLITRLEGAAGGSGAGRPGDYHPHDRLPERLRAALHGRDWFCRQGARTLPDLARRQRSQHAPQPALPRHGQGPGHHRRAAPAVRALRAGAAGRRAVRRLGRARAVAGAAAAN